MNLDLTYTLHLCEFNYRNVNLFSPFSAITTFLLCTLILIVVCHRSCMIFDDIQLLFFCYVSYRVIRFWFLLSCDYQICYTYGKVWEILHLCDCLEVIVITIHIF